jgi:hypothetical protein
MLRTTVEHRPGIEAGGYVTKIIEALSNGEQFAAVQGRYSRLARSACKGIQKSFKMQVPTGIPFGRINPFLANLCDSISIVSLRANFSTVPNA